MTVVEKFLKNRKVQYCIENTPMYLHHNSSRDILIFRRILETAQKQGLWSGFVGSA